MRMLPSMSLQGESYWWSALAETEPRWRRLAGACRAAGIEVIYTVIQSLTRYMEADNAFHWLGATSDLRSAQNFSDSTQSRCESQQHGPNLTPILTLRPQGRS